MIPNSGPPRGSTLLGNTRLAQAHVSLDKAVELAGNLALKTSVCLCPRGRLLSRYAEETIARRVTRHLRKRNVQVIIASEVDNLERRHNRVEIRFRGGRNLTADRVVLACGLRPRTALAKNAGLEVADGICVDHAMRTSDVHILAVGDCAESASATVRGNVARGIEDADKAAAVLRGQAPAPSDDRRAALRRIAIGDRDFLSIRHTHPCEASQHARITRHLPHGAFSVTLDDRRIVACQALLPKEQTDRLSQLAEEQVVIDRRMALCLRLGLLPRSSFANDPILCHCAGVRRSRILRAAGSPGDDLKAMTRATGATRYCGACLERVTAVFEGRRTKPPVRAILLSILALVAIAAAAGTPTLAPGESVRALAFKAYVLLTRNSVRQISGYVSVVFIVLALGVIAPRRRPSPMRTSSLHVIYGTLALAVLPLHVLGGVTIGSGLNRVLVAPFLICVLLGVVVFLRRSLRSALWLHAAVTVVLLAAIAIHVVDVYRY